MKYNSNSIKDYIDNLPSERKIIINKLRKEILNNIPDGFSEEISYGMIGYVVRHNIYPKGYHTNPKLPLPFMNLASQKNYIAVYHNGIYADNKLMNWFLKEYSKYIKTKPDVGKSCIRFKKFNQIPYKLIGELASKMTVNDWIKLYEKSIKK